MRPASPHPSFFHSLNALRFLLAVCCLAGPALFVMLGVPSIGTPLTPGETITAGDLTLSLNAEGRITGLYEGDTGGANHRANGRSTPLLSLVVEDSPGAPVSSGAEVHYRPQSWRYTTRTAETGETARGSYLFRFSDRIEVTVEVVQKPGYATLEVTAIANPEDKDIRLVLWGPLATDISAHVGETVGVVSDRDFAVGLIGVNARTLGGWPQQYPQTGLEAEAVGGAGQGGACRYDFAVCAALPATFGSMLQAYTRDYSVERVFKPWSAVGVEAPLPVAPLDGEQALHGQLVGSKVALFGVTRRGAVVGDESLRDVMDAAVLERLGAIGSGEDLPHPIVSKVWGKQAEQANAPYLVFTDLSSANLDRALTLANDLGWQTVYRNTDWGAFDDGSLGVGSDFGGDDAGLRATAQRTAARRVGLGSHSRFGAIPGSLAARHVADLLVTHYGVLDAELSAAATSLRLKPYPDTTATALRDAFPAAGVVRIGEELIAYGSVTPAAQGVLVLAGLQRGHEGTVAAVHAAGARAGLLGRPAGQTGYLAGLGLLQDVLAPRLVTRLNQGVSTFAFDGSADLTRGGYGALGQHLVLEQVWRELADREDFVHGAATALSYTWHLNTRYDWGVSAPDAVTDDVHYHRANQVYFRRNYLPPMLGWWRLESANEWRRALAQAAVFDAGFAWFGSVAEASRLGAPLRGEVRDWRNAQLAGAFDRQSRFLMQAPAADFRLDQVDHARGIGPTWRLSDWTPSGSDGGRRRNGRYLAPQLRGFPLTNLARDAEVTVSGVLDNSYDGALAVDTVAGVGAVAGAAGLSGAGEWAIAGTASEKWIELTWDSPQQLRRIILFDRTLPDQNVSAGTLTFTDADDTTSTLSVSGIAADGAPKVVDFAPKTVKQVRFTLTAVSGTAPGLAEFVALGPNPHYRDGTLAAGATVTGVTASEAARVTDGVIAAGTDAFATLAGNNAVLDLGGQYYLNGLAVWHYFDDARSYHDVVFEVADNEDFTDSAVVFNSDADNSLGLGAGTDAAYVESSAGKLVQFAPLPGRYIRLWSDGNTVNDDNHLTEVEVYGTGNGTTDITSGGVTSGNAAATGLGNVIDHDPATLADAGDGAQYIQLDLGREKTVNSLLVLRDNADMRTYKGVVYQLSTSADFSAGVTTVFHNDNDDLHGLGLGESTDTAYQETGNGRTVRFAPVSARYVRLYSAGSNYDNTNRYREVLVGTAQAGTTAPSVRQAPVTAAEAGSGGAFARSVAGPGAGALSVRSTGITLRQGETDSAAELIVTPTAIAQTAGDSRTDYNFNIDNVINGAGLSAPLTVNNVLEVTSAIDWTGYLWSTHTSTNGGYFSDANNPNPQFLLSLDRTYDLTALVVWGYRDVSEATDFTVEFSTDGGGTYNGEETVRTSEFLGVQTGQTGSARLDFTTVRRANRVRLTVTGNAMSRGLGSGRGGDRAGINELRFVGNASNIGPAVNMVPTAKDAALTAHVETAVEIDLSTLTHDVDRDALTWTVSQSANGNVTLTGTQAIYTSNAGFQGKDTFTYTVDDGEGGIASASITVLVIGGTPTPPAGKEWVKVWSDEFNDNTLDSTKWTPLPEFTRGTRYHDGFEIRNKFEADNVSVDNGKLVLTNTRKRLTATSDEVLSARVKTNQLYQRIYGYFEARVKIAPTADGVRTAFWLYSDHTEASSINGGVDGAADGAEIDIMESLFLGDEYNIAIHWDYHRPGGRHSVGALPSFPIHDGEYHVFGVEWNENEYKFYADGKLTWTRRASQGGISHGSTYILLSTETTWNEGNAHTGSFPNRAFVDWVRVYELRERPPTQEQ